MEPEGRKVKYPMSYEAKLTLKDFLRDISMKNLFSGISVHKWGANLINVSLVP